jgi:hypothetical protein
MQLTTPLALFLGLAAASPVAIKARADDNHLNLWHDSACSVPFEEISLPSTGRTNLALSGAQSVSPAITDPNCTPTSKLTSHIPFEFIPFRLCVCLLFTTSSSSLSHIPPSSRTWNFTPSLLLLPPRTHCHKIEPRLIYFMITVAAYTSFDCSGFANVVESPSVETGCFFPGNHWLVEFSGFGGLLFLKILHCRLENKG